MTALPPLPDHRPAVLRALDTLGAIDFASGVTMAEIAVKASLDAGQAWGACTQLQRDGFIGIAKVRALYQRSPQTLCCLTEQGRAAAAKDDADSKFAADRDRITNDEAFQAACQRYAHGNGSSAAIAAAALAVMVPAP